MGSKLHQLSKIVNERRPKKRKGRGPGSGNGKTGGRGHKGGKARSGYSVQPGYEGGQMPLYRKLPHRGFNNADFTVRYDVVNLAAIAKIQGVHIITREVLVQVGILRSNSLRYKILSTGTLSTPLTIQADGFSKSAQAKIESIGGKAELVSSSNSFRSKIEGS